MDWREDGGSWGEGTCGDGACTAATNSADVVFGDNTPPVLSASVRAAVKSGRGKTGTGGSREEAGVGSLSAVLVLSGGKEARSGLLSEAVTPRCG